MNTTFRQLSTSAIFSLLTFCSSYNALAAPGELAKAPLFVSTVVEPNVFFILDDSGSMDWEMMYEDSAGGITADSGIPFINGDHRYYWNPEWEDSDEVVPSATADGADSYWPVRNHNANKSYYNPSTTYVPWQGVDIGGSALYTNADPTATLENPNNPGGNSTDLTQDIVSDVDVCTIEVQQVCWNFFGFTWCFDVPVSTCTTVEENNFLASYYSWEDDGDGILEADDGHTLYEIKPSTTSYPSGRDYSGEMQNFANWFQYYRKREFAAKSAIGSVINGSDATRMGLDVFNDGLQKNLESMTLPSKKLELLETFYAINSSGGTPARGALKRVGELFKTTGSSAPILPADEGGECQQNFNILMTDGFWNGSDPSGIGNADRSASADDGFDGDQSESIDGGNYEDSYSDTLADVAMHYYETDLRGDLADNVPTIGGIDQASHQHLVTYTIAFGLTGTLDPDTVSPLDVGFVWPDPEDNELNKIDDLWHAAYNGRGGYLSAQDPIELANALRVSIANISERTATSAAASVTSAKLTTESIVYLAEFNTNRWQGTIYAYKIADLNTGKLKDTYEWSAAEQLNDKTPGSRAILTYDNTGSGGNPPQGIAFRWANLKSGMMDDLKTSATGTVDSDTIGQARLNYLRGDRSNEGQGYLFRERASVLGDIVNSGPVYVGKPSLRIPNKAPFPTGANAYSTFQTAQQNRTGMIYVGANDGMLHGFDEASGDEKIAYIPSNLFSTDSVKGLHYLTQQNYIHQYYNDLTPTVSDVFINNAWTTILLSGQRGGGRGYSALDVTNPASFSEANASSLVLWEFTSDDDADLGYTYSQPQIAMTDSGDWVAIFGNGYNSAGGVAKLFIVNIAAGLDGSWDAGDYKVISTGSGDAVNKNGLSTPALADIDSDGTVDRAYAGDLNGNLWVFDLDGSAGSWSLYDPDSSGSPLFSTDDDRPITAKPILAFHPNEPYDEDTNHPNVMVFVGTGQYLVENDKTSTDDDYFYGVWDKGDTGLDSSNLVEQTFRSGFGVNRVLTQNPVDYSIKYGWKIQLDITGERSVTNPAVRDEVVIFNSTIPTSDACTSGGYGYRYAVDVATGGTPSSPVLDRDKDGIVDENDTIGEDHVVPSADELTSMPTDNTFTEKVGYTGKDPFSISELRTPHIGRFSWQELLR